MKTIGITLAAVVLMILVIGFFAMRYLRAEDNDEFEDLPQERIPSRPGGDRDYADEDYSGQDYSGRPGRPAGTNGRARSRRPGADARRPGADAERQPRGYDERSGQRATGYGRRPGAAQDERGPRTAADRDGRRPAAAFEAHRGGEGGPDRRASAAPVRTAARSHGHGQDGEWASTDWDALSDVDYWAELASDKPLATTAQPASSSVAERRDKNRQAEGRPGMDPRAISQPGTDYQQLPVRQRSQPPAAGAGGTALPAPSASAEYLPAPYSYPYGRPASGSRQADSGELSLGGLAGLGDPQDRGRAAQLPGDDDPLTSPSFPAVPAADGRSYRSTRPGTPPGGSPVQAPYSAPTQQFPATGGAVSRREGYDSGGRPPATPASWPGGYGEPAGASEQTAPQQRQGYAPAAAYREHPGQLSQPGIRPAETRSPRHGGGSPAGTSGPGLDRYDSYASPAVSAYQEPAAPADSRRASGYARPAAGYPATGPQQYQAPARSTGPPDYPGSQHGPQDSWYGGLPGPSRLASGGRDGQQPSLPARSPGSYLDGGAGLPVRPATDYDRDRPEPPLPVRPARSGGPAQASQPGYTAPDGTSGADSYGYGGYPGYGGMR